MPEIRAAIDLRSATATVKGRQSVSRNGHELSVGSDNTDTSDFSCLSSTFRSVPLPTQAFADTLVTDFTDSFRGR